ncbi:MAG: 2-phosphosulfolactate phosphatase [Bacteroidales bacterium]|nr:2-phosphosulfolactate phosphatase [Bacteroidales bacterium]
MPFVDTILSPVLVPFVRQKENTIVVVVDILRSTTTICSAIDCGATVWPVQTVEEAFEAKQKGHLIAGDGPKGNMEFTDFGNSGQRIKNADVKGKSIYLYSVNGVKAIAKMQENNPEQIIVASFVNISAITDYLLKQNKNVMLLCSGWRGQFCIEDTIFCGALAERLCNKGFDCDDDSTFAALDLWDKAKGNLMDYVQKATHLKLLVGMQMEESFDYAFEMDSCNSVPIVVGNKIIAANLDQ